MRRIVVLLVLIVSALLTGAEKAADKNEPDGNTATPMERLQEIRAGDVEQFSHGGAERRTPLEVLMKAVDEKVQMIRGCCRPEPENTRDHPIH